jgi:NAD(P)-dependent dehydrogenase (short-subunit alcohol dehydrogenase family)
VLLLENHGLLVGGENIARLKSTTAYVLKALEKRVRRKPDLHEATVDLERAALLAPAIRMLLWGNAPSSIVKFCANGETGRLLKSPSAFRQVSSFSPDHLVFCKHEGLFIADQKSVEVQYQVLENALKDYQRRNKCNPLIVCVEGLGFFAHGESCKTAEIAKLAFLDAVKVGAYSESFGGPRFMTSKQIDFINNWEMETFRKKVAAGTVRAARFLGKVAVVTGAAQGFGRGIAETMAFEGGCVVVADLNAPAAHLTANEICGQWGRGTALATVTDVADDASVRTMVEQTVLAYGGIDALISNAGILRAGGLDDMDAATFELVTKVNYTAFFLCVKHVVRVMKIQHRFAPKRYFDIIQINSKSGLQGSKANFAYAGGKFGGVGLVQSFALELIEHRIKVNAICPGNFFEGPLWSDPERGLFVQYLRAKKVPGAKTVADVKKFYESKVPLGRGCSVEDVARAILYAIEQEYETGQAIPVTGGQVMLN